MTKAQKHLYGQSVSDYRRFLFQLLLCRKPLEVKDFFVFFRRRTAIIFRLTAIVLFFNAVVLAADRALLVGIENYQNTPLCQNKLRRAECVSRTIGGEEDALSLAEFISRRYGFSRSSIKLLLGKDATALNIEKQVREWLIKDSRPGDRVFFLYSGHGTQIADEDGDEKDNLDEVLAPYDVIPSIPPKNIISDDRVSQWLEQLSGRRVVWLVDSCYSGTIWRGGVDEAKETRVRFLSLSEAANDNSKNRSVSEVPEYSPLPRTVSSRDLVLIDENFSDENPADEIVVITASMPYQQAFSISVAGKGRGALSYLFEQVQAEGELPSVEELEKRLQTGMSKLGIEGFLPEQKRLARRRSLYQIPTVEIISDCSRGDLPLFAANKSPTCRLLNKRKDSDIRLRMLERKPVYFFNDKFRFSIELSAESYVYILVFSAENVVTRIFPNEEDTQNRLSAGNHSFPRLVKGKSLVDVIAQKQAGRDVWVALSAKKPLNLSDKEEYTWAEIFKRLGVSETRQRNESALSTTALLSNEWQASMLVIETRPEP